MGKKEIKQKQEVGNKSPNKQTPKKAKRTKRGRPSYMCDITKVQEPVIFAKKYETLTDIDFCIYLERVHEHRLVGLSLIDSYGKFYFLSKIACQHWQASLNNFQTQGLFDILVSISRSRVLQKFKKPMTKNVIKATIYSKNNKRKWPSNAQTKESTVEDLYYKYLKSVIFQIRPVRLVNVLTQENFDNLLQDEFVVMRDQLLSGSNKLFVVESRLASVMESFDEQLLNDPILKKFINKGMKKNKDKPLPETAASQKMMKSPKKKSNELLFGGQMSENDEDKEIN